MKDQELHTANCYNQYFVQFNQNKSNTNSYTMDLYRSPNSFLEFDI